MGQQQLLLIMLGIIIIGIALAVGLTMFNANAIEQKRNELINEMTLVASSAQLYFRKPKDYGGGGHSFLGWEVPAQYRSTEVGNISSTSITANQINITGIGNEVVTGTDSIKVKITVLPNSIQTTIIH